MRMVILSTFIFIVCSFNSLAQNYFPLRVGNIYQYIKLNQTSYNTNYSLINRTITRDTVIDNKIYYDYKFDVDSCWIRYSEIDNKLYTFYNNLERLYVDFNLVPNETFPHFNIYLHIGALATVNSGGVNLFSKNYQFKGYNASFPPPLPSCTEKFAEDLGIYQTYLSRNGVYNGSDLIMAILYDSSGKAQYFSDHFKPQISVAPIVLINASNFYLSFSVSHQYDEFPSGPPGTPLYFIQSVKFESFYSKADSIISVPTFNAVYHSAINWSATKSLDTMLLKNGFNYNYRIKATDRGLIPETSYSPDSGYYQCVWDFTSDVVEDDIEVHDYSLSQNYPNPFNPSTSIQYAIGSTQFVSLKVYDVLGNEVATLVNEYRDAGTYELEFNAEKLSSGVYYYQLRAADPSTGSEQGFIETKKMILLK
jgi:hypothetical protein